MKSSAIIAALVFAAAVPAHAAESGAASVVEKSVDAAFSDIERQIIEAYYGKHPAHDGSGDGHSHDGDSGKHGGKDKKNKHGSKELPPGLAKKDKLPPGLAKRDTLPPGLAKRNLPDDLEKRLPPPPHGYHREVVMDGELAVIVLVHEATQVVSDIIKDVVIPRD